MHCAQLTHDHEPNDQEGHQASFGVVQEVLVSMVFLGLSGQLRFHPILPFPGYGFELSVLRAEVVSQPLADQPTLGENERLFQVLVLDGNDGRFAERMHFFQLRRREFVVASFIGFQRVLELEMLQQKENAL